MGKNHNRKRNSDGATPGDKLPADPDDGLIVGLSATTPSVSPLHDFSAPWPVDSRYPDTKARPKLSKEDKARLKSFFHERQSKAIRRGRGRKPGVDAQRSQKQFSETTRDNSGAGLILKLLQTFDGDRVKVFDAIKEDKRFRRTRSGKRKTDAQLKWQIAQVAWRFGFRKR